MALAVAECRRGRAPALKFEAYGVGAPLAAQSLHPVARRDVLQPLSRTLPRIAACRHAMDTTGLEHPRGRRRRSGAGIRAERADGGGVQSLG